MDEKMKMIKTALLWMVLGLAVGLSILYTVHYYFD